MIRTIIADHSELRLKGRDFSALPSHPTRHTFEGSHLPSSVIAFAPSRGVCYRSRDGHGNPILFLT